MQRPLILVMALSASVLGTTAAVQRPWAYRLGDEGTPASHSTSGGVVFRGSSRGGSWRSSSRKDWSGFQGRGPSGVK